MKRDNIGVRVRALIVHENQMVCIKQIVGNKELWIVPGGGVESGETIHDALIREVLEETGIAIKPETKIVGCRENIIRGYCRSYEFYFICEYKSGDIIAGFDPENGKGSQRIVEAKWQHIDNLKSLQVRPDFVADLIKGTPVFKTEDYDLERYIRLYGSLPYPVNGAELIHVMLKPDSLENKVDGEVIKDLELMGGELIAKKMVQLSRNQVETIYFDFTHDRSRELVFNYLAENNTLHLVFIGQAGIHEIFNRAKGKTGTKEGLRGKYITWYTPLNHQSRKLWFEGKLNNQREVDLEMFCRNLLHVAPDPEASIRGILSVFGM